jgi:glycosyltransferase involved in cell wall biosynthesis
MESFSRTVMEAWLAGTPVLVVHGSQVVEWHCERSGGGLAFRDGPDLASHLTTLVSDTEEAARLGAKGCQYVLEEYSWPVVLDRMEADLLSLTGPTPP